MRQYSDDGWSESEWYEREPHKGNRVPLHHYRYHGEHLKNTNMWNDPAGSGEPTSSRNSHNRGVYDHGRQANPNLATDSRGARPSSALPPTKLRYHFTTLQDGLAAVMEASARHVDVEDADSRFLTFRKISDEIEGVSCELKIWSHIGNIDDIVKRDSEVVGEVNRIIVRMNARVVELSELCRIARPSDLKVEPLPDVSSDEYGSHDDAGER